MFRDRLALICCGKSRGSADVQDHELITDFASCKAEAVVTWIETQPQFFQPAESRVHPESKCRLGSVLYGGVSSMPDGTQTKASASKVKLFHLT
jgi:hypothetical protein